jgi:AcrR family transcriptional regulator
MAAKASASGISIRRPGARARVLAAAYELFHERGTRDVGIDAIVRRSGVAKMSLYHHFRSKQELVEAFLAEHDRVWTVEWLKSQVWARARSPARRLLVVFDVLGEWYRSEGFAGCPFVRVMLEYPCGHPSRRAASAHLANIREFLRELAAEAGVRQPERFASTCQMLMAGAGVSAYEGNLQAAREAKAMATLFLKASLPALQP